jgi:enoyl-CoA hydratase/carnithine racemase
MLELEERDEVTIVRMAHGKVNALDAELLQAIAKAFGGLGPGRAVVFTGAGRSFSAGVDLKRITDGGMDYVRAFRPSLSAAVMAVTKRQLQGPARDRLASVSQAEDDASTQMWASPAVRDAINGFMSALKRR